MPCPITRTTHCRLRAVNTFGKTPDDMGGTETEGDAHGPQEKKPMQGRGQKLNLWDNRSSVHRNGNTKHALCFISFARNTNEERRKNRSRLLLFNVPRTLMNSNALPLGRGRQLKKEELFACLHYLLVTENKNNAINV